MSSHSLHYLETFHIFGLLLSFAFFFSFSCSLLTFLCFDLAVYIILTWLPLYYVRAIRYYRMARDFFQGFFVASFFQLVVEYLGGEDETVAAMALKEPIDNGNRCWCGPPKKPTTFDDPFKIYLKLKRGAMQFTIVMPIIAVATMIMDLYDVYNDGNFNPAKSYVWLQLIHVASALFSMFSLKDFIAIMKEELDRQNVGVKQKFLCIQGVILGLLLQSIIISIIFNFVNNDPNQYMGEDISNFIAVCEMTFVSFAHSRFFSHKEFENRGQPLRNPYRLSRAMTDSLIPVDYVADLAYVFGKKPKEKMGLSGGYGAIPYGDDVGGDLPPPEYDPTGIQGYQQAGSKNTDVEAGTSS